MANPTFTAQLGLPDPSAAPLTVTELVNLLNTLFLPVEIGNFSNQIISGSSTPSVTDQDKLWFKLDGAGNPLGFYKFVGGNWRPVYSGKIGEITMFSGNPVGIFDSTGLSAIGSVWDGWALCNGNNGTIDLRDRFIVSGLFYTGGNWVTHVTGTNVNTGGAATHLIVEQELPSYDPNFSGAEFDSGTPNALNRLIIDSRYLGYPQTIPGSNVSSDIHYGAVGPQTPISTLPPFIAVGYVQFVGY
jgi:hypothetical protein